MTNIITHSQRTLWLMVLSLLTSLEGVAQLEPRPEFAGTEIRYYGTACFTIQRGEDALLTDPFVSNPNAAETLFSTIRTDEGYVERYINPATLKKVRMTVSGHAHYDHLMDYPYLCKYIPEDSPLIANRTAQHILSWYKLKQPTIVANDSLGSDTNRGVWYYSADSSMRVMAFKSQHPPHFAGINFMNKRYTEDVKSEPKLSTDWQEGKTMAFMADWFENDTIAYRIFFSSSLAKAPFSLFPKSMLEEHPIDDLFISAILVSDFSQAPKPLIDLAKPKRVFLMHWENFFRSKEKDVKAMKSKEFEQLVNDLKNTYGSSIEIIQTIPLNYY